MSMYGIFNLKIKRLKDNYSKEELSKNFGVFIFYDYFEKLDRFNINFNVIIFLINYALILFSVCVFYVKFFMLSFLFIILIFLIEKILYLKLKDIKMDYVYKNGYFVSGYAVKDDLFADIEFTTFDMDNLHLELEKELKLLFDDI